MSSNVACCHWTPNSPHTREKAGVVQLRAQCHVNEFLKFFQVVTEKVKTVIMRSHDKTVDYVCYDHIRR